MADFASIFKGLRLERGLTQDELAKRLGISKSTVSMYENGKRLPAFDAAESITDFFGVDLKYLLGMSDKVDRLSGDETDIQTERPAWKPNTTEMISRDFIIHHFYF